MNFEVVDGYLLGRGGTKGDVVEAFLAERSDAPAAAPFYRALEAVGVRAADEAFLALRLVLAGRAPDDGAVRRLRALSHVARAAATGDAPALTAALRRDATVFADLRDAPVASSSERDALRAAVNAAYARELGEQSLRERNVERDTLR